jgi:anti-sigma factor RsiW
MSPAAEQMTCRELVELVTDYLEEALPEPERRRFEEHVGACENCSAYIEQIRLVIRASGRLEEADLPPAAREELLQAFRGWKRGRG